MLRHLPFHFSILAALAWSEPGQAGFHKKLSFPAKKDAIETLYVSIMDAQIIGDVTYYLPEGQQYFVSWLKSLTPFDPGKPFTGMTRVTLPIPNKGYSPLWTGMVEHDKKLLMLEGGALSMTFLDEAQAELSTHTIVYDLLRPPRDRNGEATAWETKALRKRFTANVTATPEPKFVGLENLPGGENADSFNLLVSTHVEGYPLLTLSCDKNAPSQCLVARACFVEGMPKIKRSSLSGLAYEPEGKYILMADIDAHRLIVFHYQNCFNTYYVGEITLPKQIKELLSVHVDAEQNLWIGTQRMDDYHNASLYRWAKRDWYPAN